MRGFSNREAVRWCNGYRTWVLTYRQLLGAIGGFAQYLDDRGIRRGDRLLLWGENAPQWVAAFWACLARGVAVVPLDVQSSERFVGAVKDEVGAKVVVTGDTVPPAGLGGMRISFREIDELPPAADFVAAPAAVDDVVEVVYTSGTTGTPAAVIHRHRNICANLRPIEQEMKKFRRLAEFFQPIRTLNLLPLSHMFGQSLGLFIPVILGGSVVFSLEYGASAIIRTVHDERVSVLVAVPKILANLRRELERRATPARKPNRFRGYLGAAERWWRCRGLHRLLGWKFWAVVAGGARIDPVEEEFWSRLGWMVVQGYGLTETSPIVALNHPLNARQGSIGKPLPGQEVRIAEDGEILVRGENVVAEYRDADGWLHTGDLGELDAEGRLYFKGRRKDVIVTAEGLNVFPHEVEEILNRIEGVRESVVVAAPGEGGERVHAALILSNPSIDGAAVVAQANRQLESKQQIRSWSLWPGDDFPRTGSTMKVRRKEVAERVAAGGAARPDVSGGLLEETDFQTLSSLGRVELLAEIERRYGAEIDEEQFSTATTAAEVRELIREAEAGAAPPGQSVPKPRWTRTWAVRWGRAAFQDLVLLPWVRWLTHPRVTGEDGLCGITGPVIFASNHQSHMDTPVILATLPRRWRRRIAPAMSQDYFRAYFRPEGASLRERILAGLEYFLACGVFNAYPLPQRMSGARSALQYTGELADAGYCPLVFPEGRRSAPGAASPFQPGIGVMAIAMRVPVVPVRLDGVYEVLPTGETWPRNGAVQVRFGAPMRFTQERDPAAIAAAVERAVRDLKT